MKPRIRRGDLVEFTDEYYRNYPPVDSSVIRFGVCIENAFGHDCEVMTADRSVVTARYIYACSWAGWIPDGLEAIVEEFSPYPDIDYFEEGY